MAVNRQDLETGVLLKLLDLGEGHRPFIDAILTVKNISNEGIVVDVTSDRDIWIDGSISYYANKDILRFSFKDLYLYFPYDIDFIESNLTKLERRIEDGKI